MKVIFQGGLSIDSAQVSYYGALTFGSRRDRGDEPGPEVQLSFQSTGVRIGNRTVGSWAVGIIINGVYFPIYYSANAAQIETRDYRFLATNSPQPVQYVPIRPRPYVQRREFR